MASESRNIGIRRVEEIPRLGVRGRYYVYRLRYPNDVEAFGKKAGTIFYVGKGTGNRVASHEAATKAILRNSRMMLMKHKHKVILEIWDAGYQVVQEIVGRTDDELLAYEAESFYIREIGLEKLTNSTYGRRPRTAPIRKRTQRNPRH